MAGSASGGDNNPSSETTLTSIYQVPLVPSSLARPPVLWTSNEVKTWVGFCVQEFSLPQICLDKFNINGKALLILTKADFLERAPEAGDVLYNVFQHLSRSKGSSLTYNYQGCMKQPVFLSPFKDLQPPKEFKGKTSPQRAPISFVPILPHPQPTGLVNKEGSTNPLPDVPASMLSPASTEKYSSDSDSCANDAGPSPPSIDMDIDNETQKTDHPHVYLNLPVTSHTLANDHPESSEGRLLWEFIYQLLENEKYKDVLCWELQSNLTFRIISPSKLAEHWGLQKNRTNMTYEKLSRALRYYYKMNIIRKVPGKKLTYQFLQHPTQIRRGQRGARPHSHRTYTCDENKELDRVLINNICPVLPTTTPSDNPSHLSKARSLSLSTPPSSSSEQSSPNVPKEKVEFPSNNFPIMSAILHTEMESRMESTVAEMSHSVNRREEQLDLNSNKVVKENPSPSKSLEDICNTRHRPLSCPLDNSHHSHNNYTSHLNKRPPLKKTLSQPVSPSSHSNFSGHFSVMPFSPTTKSNLCEKQEDGEAVVKTMLNVECSEKPEEAVTKADHYHTPPDSFVNDSNKPQSSFYDVHSSLQSSRNESDYCTPHATDYMQFNSPLPENSNKLYSIDRQNQYNSSPSGFSSYDQSHHHGKMLQCNSTALFTDLNNTHNIHRPFMESSVPASDRLFDNSKNHINSNCVPFSTRKIIGPLKGVPSTYTSSIPEPHAHLYQPYLVHSRVPISHTQSNCQSHGLKPVILNLPEPRANNDSQSFGNFHYGSQVTDECNFKTFIHDTNFQPSHNGQSNSLDCPAMINDRSCSSSSNENYTMQCNPCHLSYPHDSSFEMKHQPADINRSLEYKPNCSSNDSIYMKFEGYRNEQEQPEDLSISVKT